MTRLAMIVSALVASAGFVLAAGTGAPDPADGAQPNVRLEIRYDTGGEVKKTAGLTCRGSRMRATGFLRRRSARRLCRVARGLRSFLATPPQHEMCTEQWGGPDRARITGRIGGSVVARRLARSDGCGIDEWNTAQPLLPKPKGAAGPVAA